MTEQSAWKHNILPLLCHWLKIKSAAPKTRLPDTCGVGEAPTSRPRLWKHTMAALLVTALSLMFTVDCLSHSKPQPGQSNVHPTVINKTLTVWTAEWKTDRMRNERTKAMERGKTRVRKTNKDEWFMGNENKAVQGDFSVCRVYYFYLGLSCLSLISMYTAWECGGTSASVHTDILIFHYLIPPSHNGFLNALTLLAHLQSGMAL